MLALALAAGAARAAPVLDADGRAALTQLPRIQGAALDESDLQGRAVVVAFFASWCPPCHPEFEHLAAAHAAFAGDDLTIVAINVFEDWGGLGGTDPLAGFLARHQPPFFVVRGDDGLRARFGGVSRIPTLFVFASDGAAVLHFVHEQGAEQQLVDRETLFAAIRAALAPGRS